MGQWRRCQGPTFQVAPLFFLHICFLPCCIFHVFSILFPFFNFLVISNFWPCFTSMFSPFSTFFFFVFHFPFYLRFPPCGFFFVTSMFSPLFSLFFHSLQKWKIPQKNPHPSVNSCDSDRSLKFDTCLESSRFHIMRDVKILKSLSGVTHGVQDDTLTSHNKYQLVAGRPAPRPVTCTHTPDLAFFWHSVV